MQGIVKIAVGSLVVGLLVLGLKYLAYLVTGSVALYSDALESLVNVATAVIALLAVRLSLQPADANHPYGHHKAEYFSAVLEGVLIVIAAILILREAWQALLVPRALTAPAQGLALNLLATAINGAWCWVLIRHGRRLRSPALEADGRHLLADVVTSVGVAVGIVLAVVTGWTVLDPALAALVALNILWSGWRVIRGSLGGLMDEAVSDPDLARIRGIITDKAVGAIQAHDLRTRRAGRRTFIDFHLVVPAHMTVSDAHEICDRVERALRAAMQDALITIHVEPENKAKHSGVLML